MTHTIASSQGELLPSIVGNFGFTISVQINQTLFADQKNSQYLQKITLRLKIMLA